MSVLYNTVIPKTLGYSRYDARRAFLRVFIGIIILPVVVALDRFVHTEGSIPQVTAALAGKVNCNLES